MTNRYILFYKPFDVLSTFTDPEGRQTVGSYVTAPGVYAAGRLDQDSEGLMLLTDDGRLAHVLTDPAHKLPKTYFVQVENVPDKQALGQLRRGVLVKGEMTLPAEVDLFETEPELPERSVPIRYRPSIPTAWLRVVLREGRKRQIRHMTAAVGHPTLRIVRVAIGPLTLRGLQPGQWRDLTEDELATLHNALGMNLGEERAAKGTGASARASRGARAGARPPRPTDRPPLKRRANDRRPSSRSSAGPSRAGAARRPTGSTPRPPGQETERPAKGNAGKGPQPPRSEQPEAPRRGRPAGGGRPPQNKDRRPPEAPREERRPKPDDGDRTRSRPPATGGSRVVGQRPKRSGDANTSDRGRPTRRGHNKG